MTCTLCSAARAMNNSDWCVDCWKAWWAAIALLSKIRKADR